MKIITRKSEREIFRFLAWILTGLVISFAVCSMLLSGSLYMHKFYNVGNVYDISSSIFRNSITQDKGHQEKTGKVVLDEGSFEWGISIYGNRDLWNYLCVQLKDTDSVQWKVDYIKQIDGEITENEEYDYTLHSGMNLLEVPHNSFNGIRITATGNTNASFCVVNVQLRENEPVWDIRKAVFYFVSSLLIYMCISMLLLFVWHKSGIKLNFYSWIEVLEKIYIVIAEQFQKFSIYVKKFVENIKVYRILAFIVMFVYSISVEVEGTYTDCYKYHIVVYSALITFIGILSIEQTPRIRKWNNSLVWSWFVLWIIACLSDFKIHKEVIYLGYVMIFVIGFFVSSGTI